MSLQLCGIAIPYEFQNQDPCTSSRIQSQCRKIQDMTLTYDSFDIAGALCSLAESAEGIMRAVDKGDTHNIKGVKLDASNVKSELTILSATLQNTVEAVNETLNSAQGKARWHYRLNIIPALTQRIILIANKMEKCSEAK